MHVKYAYAHDLAKKYKYEYYDGEVTAEMVVYLADKHNTSTDDIKSQPMSGFRT